MATRQEVFSAINNERVYQDRKWGSVDEHPHEVGSWLTIMRQLLNDAERAYMSQRGDIGALDELRKVVAVGVACMEQHGPVGRKAVDFAAQSKHFTTHKAEGADSIEHHPKRLIAEQQREELLAALEAFCEYAKACNDDSPEFDRALAAIASAKGGEA